MRKIAIASPEDSLKKLNSMINQAEKIWALRKTERWCPELCSQLDYLDQKIKILQVETEKLMRRGSKPTAGFRDIFLEYILPHLRNDPRAILNLRLVSHFFRNTIPEEDKERAINSLSPYAEKLCLLENAFLQDECSELILKCTVVGDVAGKSALLHSYVHGTYRTRYKATIGVDIQFKSLIINSLKICMNFYEISSNERFGNMTPVYFRDTNIFFIVFALNQSRTFESLEKWLNKIRGFWTPNQSIILLAHHFGRDFNTPAAIIPERDIIEACKKFNIDLWFKVDAKQNPSLEKAMNAAICLYMEREIALRQLPEPKKSPKALTKTETQTIRVALIYLGLRENQFPKEIISRILAFFSPPKSENDFYHKKCFPFFSRIDDLKFPDSSILRILAERKPGEYFFSIENRIAYCKVFLEEKVRSHYRKRASYLLSHSGVQLMKFITTALSGVQALELLTSFLDLELQYFTQRAKALYATEQNALDSDVFVDTLTCQHLKQIQNFLIFDGDKNPLENNNNIEEQNSIAEKLIQRRIAALDAVLEVRFHNKNTDDFNLLTATQEKYSFLFSSQIPIEEASNSFIFS